MGSQEHNAVDMMTDCPVCLEPLFDSQGVAQNGKVAKIMCIHLIHSDCLQRAGQSLNADGRRYGVGGFGPRAGCPICNQPVSMWTEHEQAAEFPVFWMKKIQKIVEEYGSKGEGQCKPVPVKLVQDTLASSDDLTVEQKKYLNHQGRSETMVLESGFFGALRDGRKVVVHEVLDGGPENGGAFRMYCKDYIWRWDQDNNTLWLTKWGNNGNSSRAKRRGAGKRKEQRQKEQTYWSVSNVFALVLLVTAVLAVWFDDKSDLADMEKI